MAAVELRKDALVITLTALERVAAMKREVRVPLDAVRGVCADPDPWSALRGMRVEGTGIPGVAVYGVRRMTGGRPDFAALHGRGPAVRVELAAGARYRRLLVTVADPDATVAAVRAGVKPAGGD
ncbi:MAG TPA: hypothetical protein VGI07_09950 [Solirubrobacteraceae bacterium]